MEYLENLYTLIAAFLSIYFKYTSSKEKINQRKNKEDNALKFDFLDVLISYVVQFVEARKPNSTLAASNLAEFTRLTRLIEAINRKYKSDLIGVVKSNGSEKLIIDLTVGDKLSEISSHFGTGLFQNANDELMLDQGLYIPSLVNYKGDDELVKVLHNHGVSEAYFLPFLELGLMTGYLIIAYTSIDERRISETEFSALKTRINKVKINFRKT